MCEAGIVWMIGLKIFIFRFNLCGWIFFNQLGPQLMNQQILRISPNLCGIVQFKPESLAESWNYWWILEIWQISTNLIILGQSWIKWMGSEGQIMEIQAIPGTLCKSTNVGWIREITKIWQIRQNLRKLTNHQNLGKWVISRNHRFPYK